jgi:hypothetical protein
MKAKHLLVVVGLASILGLAGCGGGGSSPAPSASSSPAAITLGDAAADNIVAFEITVTSLTLTGSAGNITVLSTPRRLELTHLSATVEHISLSSIPNGTYTGAAIAWSSPEVTFFDNAGVLHEVQSAASGTASVPVNFTVSTASVLNFDLDVANSVSVNTAAGTATFNTPVFTFAAGRQVAEVEREVETGELEHVIGSVVSASSSSVTISVGASGATMTFAVNSTTQLEGITSAAQLVPQQIVRVEGTAQADGSLLAKEIEAESAGANGLEAEGFVTNIAAPSFTLVTQDASGTSTSTADLGKTITVNSTGASFSISKTKINTGAFTFNSLADLHKGQRVEVDSDNPKSAGAGTVSDDGTVNVSKKIKLLQQTLKGSISGVASNIFTLTVPADSAFAKVTGVTAVQVINNGAQLKNGATVTNGANVRVRGLLFANSAGTLYTLVAGRITTP